MNNIDQTPLIFVLFDSILNSVFSSQILQPLLKKHTENPHRSIHIVSFERNPRALQRLVPTTPAEVTLHIFRRFPFLGIRSLSYNIYALKRFLSSFPAYQLVARGAHAGYISMHARDRSRCAHFTIQARGLLAQELEYANKRELHGIKKAIRSWQSKQLNALETQLYNEYSTANDEHGDTLEAVSPALKEYLITHYQVDPAYITIAHDDIPEPIPLSQRTHWRQTIRSKLGISAHTRVYCYNGSVKPWQMPDLVINFFKQEQEKHQNSFLLLITQDKAAFQQLLKKYAIDTSRYYLCTIAHQEVYQYLSASDFGLIFRDPHPINWVSRPTKALEYHAAGLTIVHNNTVAFLSVI
jgi:hypothetical protein